METQKFDKMIRQAFAENPLLIPTALSVASEMLEEYREKCKTRNDSDLRNFAELSFPYFMETLDTLPKKKVGFFRQVLQADWIKEMFKRLKFDHPNHCVAVKEAWEKYQKM